MMGSTAILVFNGDFKGGFHISLEIKNEGGEMIASTQGFLPANLQILSQYEKWQESFHLLLTSRSRSLNYRSEDNWEEDSSLVTNVAINERDRLTWCQQCWHDLQMMMSDWLQSKNARLNAIETQLTREFYRNSTTRLSIRSQNTQLWRLPWYEWSLLKTTHRTIGISYSFSQFEKIDRGHLINPSFSRKKNRDRQTVFNGKLILNPTAFLRKFLKSIKSRNKVRILAIFGDERIEKEDEFFLDLKKDKREIKKLDKADPVFLEEDTLSNILLELEQDYKILFFAGHSGKKGLKINKNDYFNLDRAYNTFHRAISKGLKIAIFNSCNSLELAEGVLRLNMPFIIAMQEQLPDSVAQSFLKDFLIEYSNGTSLHTSVRRAGENLEVFADLPGAVLLPKLIQNPAEIPPRYKDLSSSKTPASPLKLSWVLVTSLAIASLVVWSRWHGILQPMELKAYDFLIRQQTISQADDRIVVVGITQEDEKEFQKEANPDDYGGGGRTLPDQTINDLLEEIYRYNPKVVGLDFYRHGKIPDKKNVSVFRDKLENDNLIVVCAAPNKYSNGEPAYGNAPAKNIGFSDFAFDEDDVIRRHLLYLEVQNMKPCKNKKIIAFSIRLANRYLGKFSDISERFKIDKLKFRSGAYNKEQELREIEGGKAIQLMLNYRPYKNYRTDIVKSVYSAREILKDKNLSLEDIENRIVLIGSDNPHDHNEHDKHITPYTSRRKTQTPGIFIHAQMVSHLLDILEGKRPLIYTLTWQKDALLIGLISLISGILSYGVEIFRLNPIKSLLALGIGGCTILTIVYVICLKMLTTQGLWLPLYPCCLTLLMTIIGVKAAKSIFTQIHR